MEKASQRVSKVKRPELSICVFTGSRHGASPKYAQAAMEFSEELVKQGMGLVYGGGNVGLMNVVANTALEHDAALDARKGRKHRVGP